MTASLIRTAALLLGSTACLSQAATVNLSDWAYGNGWNNIVEVDKPGHHGPAGGFIGTVTFADGGESGFSGTWSDFITYCVEIDESFRLPSGNMIGYEVVAGADYAKWNNANLLGNANSGNTAAGTAQRLGQLLSYVGSNGLVSTADESTSLQLAIWNIIYDKDDSVTKGRFKEKSKSDYNDYADTLLSGAAKWEQTLEVYVLSRSGSQDFVLTRPTAQTSVGLQQNRVPEPASLALSVLGLAAAGATSHRRRG